MLAMRPSYLGTITTMSRRSRAREVVLQLLYQDDLNPAPDIEAIEAFLRMRLNNREDLIDFARDLRRGVRANREEFDALLQERAANWSLARMAAVQNICWLRRAAPMSHSMPQHLQKDDIMCV